MKKQLRSRYLSVLCLLVALALLVSCNSSGDLTDDTLDTLDTAQQESFVLDTSVFVVISEKSANSAPIKEALSLFGDACRAYFDKVMKVSDDWYRGEMVRNPVEILVGTTNRPESIAAAEGLTYYDYTYEVVSPDVVVICGGSDEATLAATQKFLQDCYGFISEDEAGAFCNVPVGTSYSYRHEYTVKDFTLCDKPIQNYSIVSLNNRTSVNAATLLQTEIERICGIELPIVTNTDYTGGDAILLGMAKPDGSHMDRDFGKLSYAVKLEKVGNDHRLIVDSNIALDLTVEAFTKQFFKTLPNSGSVSLAFSEGIYCAYYSELANGLRLVDQSKGEILADGVIYRDLIYKDGDGMPVLGFAIEADLSKVSVLNATPNNGTVLQNAKATTKQAMQALVSAGYQVLAGINADFFDINGDYSPSGLCVKDGVELNVSNTRPWFGITADGTPVIGDPNDYTSTYKGKLKEAVGGSHILLKDGMYYDVGITAGVYNTEFSSTRHPRTAVGFTDDGKLILLVVDGRQTAHSNGASLADLAEILLALGATDAINLDGGGSSTMITYANGSYKTRNKPSDGNLRAVFNSLVIVKK